MASIGPVQSRRLARHRRTMPAPPLHLRVQAAKAQLSNIAGEFAPAALASSFGAEDMVLVDLIVRYEPTIGIFTLDTGRLPPQTLALIDRVHDRYAVHVEIY